MKEIIRPAVEGLSNNFDNDCVAGLTGMHFIFLSILFYFCPKYLVNIKAMTSQKPHIGEVIIHMLTIILN